MHQKNVPLKGLMDGKVITVLQKQIFCQSLNTNMEKRTVIKFHEKLVKSASATFWLMQQVYDDNFLSRANVFLWHKRFLKAVRG